MTGEREEERMIWREGRGREGGKDGGRKAELMILREGGREGGKDGGRKAELMILREGGREGGRAEWMILREGGREGGREGRMDEKGGKDDLERGKLGTWGRRKGRR